MTGGISNLPGISEETDKLDLLVGSVYTVVIVGVVLSLSRLYNSNLLSRLIGAFSNITTSQAQTLFSLVLVLVTFLYFVETRRHTKEMEKSREPVVKANIVEWHAIHVRLTVENIGNGTARNVHARWHFENSDFEEEFKIPILSPGDSHMFYLPFEGEGSERPSSFKGVLNELDDSNRNLVVNIDYEDTFGDPVSSEDPDVLDVKDFLESRRGEMIVEDEMYKIRTAVEDISSELDDIASAIELDGFGNIIKSRKREIVISSLERSGTLTVSELSNITGISQIHIIPTLSNLKEAEIIDYDVDGSLYDQENRDTQIHLVAEKSFSELLYRRLRQRL